MISLMPIMISLRNGGDIRAACNPCYVQDYARQ